VGCGSGGGGQIKLPETSAQLLIDTSLPENEQSLTLSHIATISLPENEQSLTLSHIATITNYQGLNIIYWGTKDSTGKPTSMTQTLSYQEDPTKGVRTFLTNGVPTILQDLISGAFVYITWATDHATFAFYDKTGVSQGSKTVTANGSGYLVSDLFAAKGASSSKLAAYDKTGASQGAKTVTAKGLSYVMSNLFASKEAWAQDATNDFDINLIGSMFSESAIGLGSVAIVGTILTGTDFVGSEESAVGAFIGAALLNDSVANASQDVIDYLSNVTSPSAQVLDWLNPIQSAKANPNPDVLPLPEPPVYTQASLLEYIY